MCFVLNGILHNVIISVVIQNYILEVDKDETR